jgi:long-chain fatty acid transport protein
MTGHRKAGCVLILALLFLGRSPLTAQTNLETNAGVHFNFTTPGAGNLALGGAFLALAFDASAAYTNPAGLTTIIKPEALIEARHWTFTHVFTDRGRIEGQEPSGDGIDLIAGLRDGRSKNQVTGLSFLSSVYPYRDGSFAVYRHEVVNFRANFSTTGAYLGRNRTISPLGFPRSQDGRLAALRNRMDVDVVAYGGAAAYRLGKGFSLGLAVSYFDFAIDSTAQRYLPDFLEKPTFAPSQLVSSQTQKGEDSAWGVGAGFLWESPRKRWSVGGVYRQGSAFAFRARSQPEAGPLVVPFEPKDQQAVFHVPDVYGVGFAFRPKDAFRLAFDYDRVRYSQLTQGFVDIFGQATLDEPHIAGEDVVPFPDRQDPELNRFVIDDADELHLGLEYGFLQSWPIFTLRAGAWYEPDHSLRFEGDNVGFRATFRRRDAQMHYTAGAGLALRRIQVDAAIDYSERVSVIALSTGLRF